MKLGSDKTTSKSSKAAPQNGTFTKARQGGKSANTFNSNRSKQTFSGKMTWLAIAALLLATASIASSVWLSVQLMVDPQALTWFNQWLPNWIAIPTTGLNAQTVGQIKAEIEKTDRHPGEFLLLGKNRSILDSKSIASDLLLPVMGQQPNCQTDCERIVELRLYQSVPPPKHQVEHPPRFELINQLAIAGPEESFVIAPLVNARSANQGSARSLPLTTLKRFEGHVPAQGIWLNLSGQWSRADNTVKYGTIVHYNPGRFHLSPMLEWNSTTNEDPQWQQVTGGSTSELVLNQTVGMEPQFKIYQLQPRNFLPNPIQLEPISLADPAIDQQTYSKALQLARSGLWSTSWQWLQTVKQRSGKNWPAVAQAQMDLIRWHAQATQTQAEKSWASPNQQVLANLVDGRWLRALYVFKASPENSLETADLLRANPDRLLNRIEATLQINASQPEVKAWGALLIAAQRGKTAAIAWLKKQPKTTAAEITHTSQLIKRMEISSEYSSPESFVK